ncbi:MAG: SDR family oxidoreductase [Rhodospirillaceae bacterium]|nr:SDR family oxidoreductase [Rhodospirillaceae bacterium]MCA8932604.1 SDR family oxidoreductase [Rhodospirillaceae bacterium]
MDPERRTLVLTGASRGIGHATVKRFASAGWRVITLSRMAFSEDCPWADGEDNHVQADLSTVDGIELAVADLRKRIGAGGLHALVNNAGISPKGPDGARLNTLTTAHDTWNQVFSVNLFAPVFLARGLIDPLRQVRGAIVNVTSIAGSRVHPFAGTAYATSKAALAALTREMAADFGPYGIRVNAIAPGEIETAILSPGTADLAKSLPLRRLGQPEEVAAVIHFLCSAQASYINGAEVQINGGQHV